MLEKLYKFSVSFMTTTPERLYLILSYTCPFEVLFASLENLLKKLQLIYTSQKQNWLLSQRKYASKIGHLIIKNTKSHIGQNNTMKPFSSPIYRRDHQVQNRKGLAQYNVLNHTQILAIVIVVVEGQGGRRCQVCTGQLKLISILFFVSVFSYSS